MSEQSRRDILEELGKTSLSEQGTRDDNDFGGPAGSDVGISRNLIGQITAVFGTTQPKYSAVAIDNDFITVTRETPILRNLNGSTAITPAEVGSICELVRDENGIWHISLAHEFLSTSSCEDVAGSRNNMAFQLITVTPTNILPITADWIDADTTLAAITLTLPESEVGKRITVANIGSTGKRVTITNTVNGTAGIDILFRYDAPEFAYNGTEWRIV